MVFGGCTEFGPINQSLRSKILPWNIIRGGRNTNRRTTKFPGLKEDHWSGWNDAGKRGWGVQCPKRFLELNECETWCLTKVMRWEEVEATGGGWCCLNLERRSFGNRRLSLPYLVVRDLFRSPPGFTRSSILFCQRINWPL